MRIDGIVAKLHEHHPLTHEDEAKIRAAYDFAFEAHKGQLRDSGDPFIIHPLAVAGTLAEWRLDTTSVIAGLLHDTVEDTDRSLEDIKATFGEKIAFIVDGVTKIGRQVRFEENLGHAETLRKMVLALGKDVRVVFVKLADRLHNMETLDARPISKHRRTALETVEIYSPLAYRLGMTQLSGDLEDLAFPYLYPREYEWLTKALHHHLQSGHRYLNTVRTKIEELLHKHQLQYNEIDARVKRLSSLYKKMRRLDMDIEKVYDLIALRLIVPTVADCYAVLGHIHEQWPPMPGKIKDYIAMPKPNGYRSLHTTVYCIDGKPTEFQIRTADMHRENEHGLAAYWAYQQLKGGKEYETGNRVSFARRSEFDVLNQLKNWQENFANTTDFFESLKIDLFQDRIFVLTPQGQAIDLPIGATPIDFAYAIHTDIGNTCIGARVNNKLVSLDHELQSGDGIEILMQRRKKPNRSWLEFVKTARARSEIRAAWREETEKDKTPSTHFRLIATDRVGLMKDIAAIFARNKINMQSVTNHQLKGSRFGEVRVTTLIEKPATAEKILLQLKQVKGMKEVELKQ